MTMKKYNILTFVFIIFILIINTVTGDIRCHCNLPQCISTGYMCKSVGASASCYSLLTVHTDGRDLPQHGCIEYLQSSINVDICDKLHHHHHHAHAHHTHHHHSLPHHKNLSCCYDDMCNYVRNIDMDEKVQTKNVEGPQGIEGPQGSLQSSHSTNTLPNLWFRIAVIVVPIAGSIVLVLLILMAAKVLRQDSKRQRQSAEIRKQRQFKTNLLLNSNGITGKCRNYNRNEISRTDRPEKNETNAKMNDLERGFHDNGIPDNGIDSSSKVSSLYDKNINLAFSRESNINVNDNSTQLNMIFEKPINTSLYSSLLSWGNWDFSSQSKEPNHV